MKRYQFRLAAVLRLRRAEEEQARNTLAAANARLRTLIGERDAQAERYAQLVRVPLATTVDGLLAEQQRTGLVAAAVAGARRAVTVAAADAALAQVAWAGASRRVRILERLDDRRRAEHAAEEQRAETAAVDDLVTARYVNESRGAELPGTGSWRASLAAAGSAR